MYIEISFVMPERLHPGSNTATIADVAFFLEAKYHLIQKFTEYARKPLEDKVIDIIAKENKVTSRSFVRISEWIKGEWRDFMVKQLHKIKTKVATQEDRESFIVTGAYYKSLECVVELKNEELKD